MGRTGTLHAWEQEQTPPDIQVVAKGLGGGYQPIGAVLASGRVVDAIRNGSGAFQHGHTYLAHPIACSAALAVQRTIRDENLLEQVGIQGALLDAALMSGSATTPTWATSADVGCSERWNWSRIWPPSGRLMGD